MARNLTSKLSSTPEDARDRRHQFNADFLNHIIAVHDDALRRFARVRATQRNDADDLVQEVYVRLSQQEDLHAKFAQRQDTLRAYLFRMLDNVLIDNARRAQVRQQAHHVNDDTVAILSTIFAPERHYICQHQLRRVEAILATLPKPHQHAFWLHRYEGLSYREVSNRLHVSMSTVEKYLAATLLALRKGVQR